MGTALTFANTGQYISLLVKKQIRFSHIMDTNYVPLTSFIGTENYMDPTNQNQTCITNFGVYNQYLVYVKPFRNMCEETCGRTDMTSLSDFISIKPQFQVELNVSSGISSKCDSVALNTKQSSECTLDTHSVWMLLKESNVPLASDWMLLSYKDLQQMHRPVVSTVTLSCGAALCYSGQGKKQTKWKT